MKCSNGPVIPAEMVHVYQHCHVAPAVRAGDFIICSGVLGQRLDGTIPDDHATEFALAFENLRCVLAAAGAELAHIVELVTFHTDLEGDLGSFTTVKERFMHEPYPAWTAVGVTHLGAGSIVTPRVEIKATAYLVSAP
ncbi:RidA family protein [Prescottella agglutinans]|uniref:RidA family protein n=1 Tax=Prescottella agglutinans TaxID=1644129 RepID=UPI0013E3895F|nr:RidA family protein [Prescottella agglutinans]